MSKRTGKTSKGSHEYKLHLRQPVSRSTAALLPDHYTACRMGNNEWLIFRDDDGVKTDMGVDFKTLKECRVWFIQMVMGMEVPA